ncbi:MAG: V-type ATP synthase subunit F [Candidatus Micrarchaeia archaeon]
MEKLNGENVYKIGVIGSEPLVTGFKLAGVKLGVIVKNGEEAEKALSSILENREIGLVVIGEGVSNNIKSKKLLHVIDTSLMPLIVEIPDYGERELENDTLRRLILKAVGIDITKVSKFK